MLNKEAKLMLQAQIKMMLNSIDKTGAAARWPMPILKSTVEASIYSEPIAAKKFYEYILKLKKLGLSFEEIKNVFSYPSPLARMTMIFRSRAIWKLNQKQQLELYNYLGKILSLFYQEDAFCAKGKNILLVKSVVNKLIKKFKKQKSLTADLISQIDGRLWMYTETIFSRWHNLGHEFHGPYKISKNNFLIVKEWHDLQGLGQKIFSNFPYKKIICYEFYKNSQVTFDMHNRMSSSRPLINSISKCFVEADGKILSTAQVEKLKNIIDAYLFKGARYLSKMNKNDLKIMNATMEFYVLKPLADYLKIDWQPPVSLIKKINSSKIEKKEGKVLEILKEYYKSLNLKNLKIQFDPTVKFS